MSAIGNLIWIVSGGLLLSLGWVIAGIICCATIVGIPFGLQCFKIAGLVLAPFGKNITVGRGGAMSVIGNIFWVLFLGWELALSHLVTGLFLCITVIGIPFGLQHFKLAQLALVPFGLNAK